MSDFTHLRAHSHYSIEDGLMSPADLIKAAAADGQGAMAITDLAGRMFGTIEFFEAARSKGVKPIVGVDVWVDPDVTQGPDAAPVRLLLLAQNQAGYKKILDWVSRSYTDNQHHDKPRLRQSWFRDEGTEGVEALSGSEQDGEIALALLSDAADPVATAVPVLEAYRGWFGDRFHLEVQRAGFAREADLVARTVALSDRTGTPLVATHPIQFPRRQDYFAHEIKTCISSGKTVSDVNRKTPFTREQFFQTRAEMEALFADLPEALENAGRLARRCVLDIEIGKNHLPSFPTPDGSEEADYFAKAAREGLERRLLKNFPDPAVRAAQRPIYDERLEREIKTIAQMGFPGYYLIVSDFIGWAKEQGVPVGPGRGSGAGSLAAYAMDITDIDPMPYDLLFERFLNPERVSMPDFDIDFCMDRRDEVIDYVRQKYGENSVSRISTFMMLKAKAAIKAAGRAIDAPFGLTDSLSKMIPNVLDISLEEAAKDEKLAARLVESPDARRLFTLARSIENKPSAVSIHAGGVIIAPGKSADYAPLHLTDAGQGAVSQYDYVDAEKVGLVKFDFLGLKTLTVIDQAVRLINARPDRAGNPLDITSLDITDAPTYALLGEAKTVGVFQFESSGMQGYIRKLQPSGFEDIVALAALFRPGPLSAGMVDDFINRRHGRSEVAYPHPMLEPVLKPTYGVIVYQEQVMQIAQVMAGYSLGGADLLRRAMGKKDAEKMAKERSKFEEGAKANGVDAAKATEIFDLMEMFADYGFNKSHSAAYALVAFQTAWLKTHYPSEFYAANLNVNASDTEKVMPLINDARKNGVDLLPPDVNEGYAEFTAAGDRAVRYGLMGLKGVGSSAIKTITDARETHGKFESFFDFCKKVGRSGAGKTVVEALVRAGAFDSLHPNRAAVMEAVPAGLKYAAALAKVKPIEAGSLLPELFGDAAPAKKKAKPRAVKPILEPMLNDVPEWSKIETLEHERSAMGFYLSGHPFEGYAARLDGLSAAVPLDAIDGLEAGVGTHLVGGVVASVREITNKNKEKQAYLTLDDGRSSKDVTVFAGTWAEVGGWVKPGVFLALEAKIEEDTYRGDGAKKLTAEQVLDFDALQSKLAQGVHLAVKKQDLAALEPLLRAQASPDGAGLPVSIYLPDTEDRYFRADLPTLRINNTPSALAALRQAVGEDRLRIDYASTLVFEQRAKRGGPRRNGRGP